MYPRCGRCPMDPGTEKVEDKTIVILGAFDSQGTKCEKDLSKKSPAGPTEQTPKREYLIARSQLT